MQQTLPIGVSVRGVALHFIREKKSWRKASVLRTMNLDQIFNSVMLTQIYDK